MSDLLIQRLQNPALYSHPVKYFKIIETHISYVLLTGDYAYKIKKPLDMEFLDFSTLEKRKFYCHEEVRLNKRFSPELYIDVLEITGSAEKPEWNGNNHIFEYAIQMREFPQNKLFTNLLKNNLLKSSYFISLAEQLANSHQKAAVAKNDTRYGLPEQLFFPVQQNFDQIRPLLNDPKELKQLDLIEKWAQEQYKLLKTVFLERKTKGFIRECHGDLHLGNIVLYHDKPLIFDCLEFNLDLLWTDVMADVGFLVMDLQEKLQQNFAILFLNHYLAMTSDYAGLAVLKFYESYRAVVRAKIYLMQLQQVNTPETKAFLKSAYLRSMQMAESYMINKKPQLFIMHGLSGSGKTTKAMLLAEKFNAIHLRSDVERYHMMADLGEDKYSEKNRQKIYERLAELAKQVLHEGYSVIVDATFLLKSQRDLFSEIGQYFQLPCQIAVCEADDNTRSQWLHERLENKQDFSEADITIARQQQKQLELLSAEEQTRIVKIP